MTVLVAGAGPVARALVASLGRAGLSVATWSRGAGIVGAAGAGTAIVAVSDGAIGVVAARLLDEGLLAPRPVLLHCAGALAPTEALGGVAERLGGLGLLHPLRALARAGAPCDLRGSVFGVSGDATGRARALELVAVLGGVALPLEEAALPRYHAAAALASNHTLALVAAAIDLLVGEGLSRRAATGAVVGLLRGALDNVDEVGLPAALTGPLARGDLPTVERHLQSLPPAVVPLYRASGCATVDLARTQGRASPERLEALAILLGCGITNDSKSNR